MTTPRTLRVRLATGGAAGGLALAALTGLTAGTASAAPAAPAAPAAQVAPAGPAATAAAGSVGTTTVRTVRQLRRAVLKANKRAGKERIKIAKNLQLDRGTGNGDGPLKGDLDVNDDLVIVGQGHSIDARGVDRIFDVLGTQPARPAEGPAEERRPRGRRERRRRPQHRHPGGARLRDRGQQGPR